MTTENLDKLDRLAAEKVMGLKLDDCKRKQCRWDKENNPTDYKGCYSRPGKTWHNCYTPTRNIEEAWELLEKLMPCDFTFDCGPNRDTGVMFYSCRIDDINLTYADTASLAIVKAALKSKGISVD